MEEAMKGKVDEVHVWDRMLSPAEITARFTGGPDEGACDCRLCLEKK
jgi:hypothetical protein